MRIIPLNAEKIVFVGGGPIGLAQAIALKQMGLDVSIVDPRLGRFTRSGDHSDDVTSEINKLINPFDIVNTTGSHIKMLQRQLFEIVEELEIPCYKQKFSNFIDHEHIEISNHVKQKQALRADLVFDCTGTKRVCLKKANEIHPDTFSFEILPNNPHQRYAQVRAIMPLKETGIINKLLFDYQGGEQFEPDPVVYALGMEALREMGWKEFRLPYIYQNDFAMKEIHNVGISDPHEKLRKSNIYTQLPPDMKDPEEIKKFVRIVIKILKNDPADAFNEELLPLRMHGESREWRADKPMVTVYDIVPIYTTPGFYLGDNTVPPVIHAGDATLNLPFHTAESMVQDAKRCIALNDAFIIKDKKIVGINRDKYKQGTMPLVINARQILQDQVDFQRKLFQSHDARAFRYYVAAYERCHDPEKKKKIAKGLQILYLNKAAELIKSLDNLPAQELVNNRLYFKFPFMREYLKPEEIVTLNNVQKKFAEQCKKAGDDATNTVCSNVFWYRLGLEILEQNKENSVKEIITLFSCLIIAQTYDFSEVIQLADRVAKEYYPLLASFQTEQKEDNVFDRTLEKIAYHKTVAMIQKAEKMLNASNKDMNEIQLLLNEIENSLPSIKLASADITKQYQAFKDKHFPSTPFLFQR